MRVKAALHLQRPQRLSILLATMLLLGTSTAKAQEPSETAQSIQYLSIPTVSQSLTKGFYSGLAKKVTRQTGKKITFHFPSSYCQTIRHAVDPTQNYDVLNLPPHIVPIMMRLKGYTPIIVSSSSIRGVFAFRDEKRNKQRPFKIALADKYATTSFAAQQQIAQLLSRHKSTANISLQDIEFVNHVTHDNALVSFFKGNTDAVAIVNTVFNRSVNLFKSNVISSVYSADYPRVVLLARPGLDLLARQQLTAVFTVPRDALTATDPFADIDIRAIKPNEYLHLLTLPDMDISECLNSERVLSEPYLLSP